VDVGDEEGTTAAAAAGNGAVEDVNGEEDAFSDLSNTTTYTHQVEDDRAPWMGCKLFARREDQDILGIAARLRYIALRVQPHSGPPVSHCRSLPTYSSL
jgi:hypothetical protein